MSFLCYCKIIIKHYLMTRGPLVWCRLKIKTIETIEAQILHLVETAGCFRVHKKSATRCRSHSEAVGKQFTTSEIAGLGCLPPNLDCCVFNPQNPLEGFQKLGKETRTNWGLGNIIYNSCNIFFLLC